MKRPRGGRAAREQLKGWLIDYWNSQPLRGYARWKVPKARHWKEDLKEQVKTV